MHVLTWLPVCVACVFGDASVGYAGVDDQVVPDYFPNPIYQIAANLDLSFSTSSQEQITAPISSGRTARKKRRVSFAPHVHTSDHALSFPSDSAGREDDHSNRGRRIRSTRRPSPLRTEERVSAATPAIPRTSTQSVSISDTHPQRSGRRVARTISGSARESIFLESLPLFLENPTPVPDILDMVISERQRQLYSRFARTARVPDTSEPLLVDFFQ